MTVSRRRVGSSSTTGGRTPTSRPDGSTSAWSSDSVSATSSRRRLHPAGRRLRRRHHRGGRVLRRAAGGHRRLVRLQSSTRMGGDAWTAPTTSCAWRSRPPWPATSASSPFSSRAPGCPTPRSCRTAWPSWPAARPWSSARPGSTATPGGSWTSWTGPSPRSAPSRRMWTDPHPTPAPFVPSPRPPTPRRPPARQHSGANDLAPPPPRVPVTEPRGGTVPRRWRSGGGSAWRGCLRGRGRPHAPAQPADDGRRPRAEGHAAAHRHHRAGDRLRGRRTSSEKNLTASWVASTRSCPSTRRPTDRRAWTSTWPTPWATSLASPSGSIPSSTSPTRSATCATGGWTSACRCCGTGEWSQGWSTSSTISPRRRPS